MVRVIACASVQWAAIVPDYQIMGLPRMGQDRIRLHGMFHQAVEQLAGLSLLHTLDSADVGTDEQVLPSVHRIAPYQPLTHRRQGFRQVGTDCVLADLGAAEDLVMHAD